MDKFRDLINKIPDNTYTQNAYKAVFLLGLYSLTKSVVPKLGLLYNHLFANSNLKKQYGNCWAVVTGGSDGLGRAYASTLAKSGFNTIIIGRNQDRLNETSNMLKTFNVQVETISFDFNTTDQTAYDGLTTKLTSIGDIGILINNVGAFEMADFDQEKKAPFIINLNVLASTYLSQGIVKHMKTRDQRSLLAFVGSETGENPHAGYAIQAATKAYTGHLARSLAVELKDKIDVRLFTPGPTLTQMLLNSEEYMKTLSPRLFGSKPIDVASEQLRKVNCYVHVAGTVRHGAMLHILKNYPKSWKFITKMYGE